MWAESTYVTLVLLPVSCVSAFSGGEWWSMFFAIAPRIFGELMRRSADVVRAVIKQARGQYPSRLPYGIERNLPRYDIRTALLASLSQRG